MAYKVVVKLRGTPYTLSWNDNGTVSGDTVGLAWLEIHAKVYEGLEAVVGLDGGPYFTKAYLQNPLAAYALMHLVFDEIAVEEGEVSPPPSLPPGAIA